MKEKLTREQKRVVQDLYSALLSSERYPVVVDRRDLHIVVTVGCAGGTGSTLLKAYTNLCATLVSRLRCRKKHLQKEIELIQRALDKVAIK